MYSEIRTPIILFLVLLVFLFLNTTKTDEGSYPYLEQDLSRKLWELDYTNIHRNRYEDQKLLPHLVSDTMRHITKIKNLLPDEYIGAMFHVAHCESGFQHRDEKGRLLQNTGGSPAIGIFQVHAKVHKPELKKRGLNLDDDNDYYEFVSHLVQKYGLNPWNASKHCWGQRV